MKVPIAPIVTYNRWTMLLFCGLDEVALDRHLLVVEKTGIAFTTLCSQCKCGGRALLLLLIVR